jgi:hypothetical protein
MDIIITESKEYNVLLGNTWLKYVGALVDYKKDRITIEHDDIEQIIPVTCTQKIDPSKFIAIDVQ